MGQEETSSLQGPPHSQTGHYDTRVTPEQPVQPWSRPYTGVADDADPAGAPAAAHAAPEGAAVPAVPAAGDAVQSPAAPSPTAQYPAMRYPGPQYQPGQHATGQPPTGQFPTGQPPTGQYPTAQYPGAVPPGAPHPAAPGQFPGAGYPGGPDGPPVGPASGSGSGSGRFARGMVIAIGAVALALTSGVVGGLAVDRSNDSAQPARTVTIQPAPQLDRSSVADVAAAILPSVVDISTGQGEGSGVVISADGAIVTNNHVVAGATGDTVTVTFGDGKSAKATIVGTDPVGDIAVIKAEGVSNLKAAKFGDSDAARVGDPVLAIGSPLGLQGSVSEGIVSALHRTIDSAAEDGGRGHSIGDAIQTDAAINPGNSGGALVNLAGEVIGINTAILTSGQGAGNIGVGFAISSNKAKSSADQLMKGGKVSHPYVGLQLTDGTGGALVADVVADGPAAKAGLQKGDVITKAGDRNISSASTLVAAVQAGKPGDKVELTVQRGGAEQKITVTLGDTP